MNQSESDEDPSPEVPQTDFSITDNLNAGDAEDDVNAVDVNAQADQQDEELEEAGLSLDDLGAAGGEHHPRV